jgi:hypothetical protein
MATERERRSIFEDVLTADQLTGGHPVATEDQRPALIEAIEHIVLDVDARLIHQRWLRSSDPARRHHWVLPDERMQEVLDGGLDVLEGGELAELALNPVALAGLADAVTELDPDAWMSRIEEAASDLVRRHGVHLTVPSLRRHELMMMGSLEEGGSGRASWQFSVTIEDCRWEPGVPDDLGETVAVLLVERVAADGSLVLSPEGFLRVGLSTVVETVWRASDGTVRATGRVADDFAPLRLVPDDTAPPAPGDKLELTKHMQATAATPAWSASVTVDFP